MLTYKMAGIDTTWTTGVRDIKYLSKRRLRNMSAHMENTVKLAMLGRVNIATQLDKGHRIGMRKHNKAPC